MTRTMSGILVLLLTLVSMMLPGCGSTPLVYSDMTQEQKQDEEKLQQRLERAAQPIARIGMRLVDDPAKQTAIAKQVVSALDTVEKVLASKNASDWQKAAIAKTAEHLQLLTPDIQELAQDAFDLFNGQINLPGLNDVIPEVIRDRLLAFIRGAKAGLSEFTQEG